MTGGRVVAAILVVAVVGAAVAESFFASRPLPDARDVAWGVTFSQKASGQLGLDWRANYRAIVRELRPAGLRLVAYWDLIEPARGRYEFSDLDWQISEAEKAGIPVVLAVGEKVPRWPEYHLPQWARADDTRERQAALLTYLAKVVDHYRGSAVLRYWQVENEPYVDFGVGPPTDPAFLEKEIALVRKANPRHRILTTDGGEWGRWHRTAVLGDALGFTLYRSVFNRSFGTFSLPLTPEFYELKERVTKLIDGRPYEEFICVELQAEPWGPKPIARMTVAEQEALFPRKAFTDAVGFARRTRVTTFYFWGAEWWYYLDVHGRPGYWRQARDVIRGGRPPSVPSAERAPATPNG
jgi:hypothetical protein